MTTTTRESNTLKSLLDGLKKNIGFTQSLVLTTLPRGGLQVAQPSRVPDAILKSYNKGFHASDRLTWQAILRGKPVQPQDVWTRDEFLASAYSRELMLPLELKYAVALPLAAPVLAGYPGAIHLCRSAEQGAFSAADLSEARQLVKDFESRQTTGRAPKKSGRRINAGSGYPTDHSGLQLTVMDSKFKSVLGGEEWASLDARLRDQMIEQAKRRMHQLNGHGFLADRVQFPDSHDDVWTFRVVTYREYPAIGEGSYSFFCLQPGCSEWGGVKASDFQADEELARLIPAMRYMQMEFRDGPTLVDIAKTAELSPFHFHRRFTELLGLTPKQFMLECQIHEAKSDLMARDKELTQIARECGFAHQSHFTSRFKQATGLTPTRWRKMMTERQKVSKN